MLSQIRPMLYSTRALLVMALVLATGACRREPPEARFVRTNLGPCPAFGDGFLKGSGLPGCPIDRGTQTPKPCAVEHYIEGDSNPRTTRRLAFDAAGRLSYYSDHRGAAVTDARQVLWQQTGVGQQEASYFLPLCGQPTARYLYSLTLSRDTHGRLKRAQSTTGFEATIDYAFEPGWLSHDASITIAANRGPRRQLHIDPFGYISSVTVDGAQQARGAPTIEVRNGRLHHLQWAADTDDTFDTARYRYDGNRLTEIGLESAGRRGHRYRFRYHCTDSPSCVDSFAGTRADLTPHSRSALSLDPSLKNFRAHNCSDQLAHGPRLCGTVLHGHGPISARCCAARPDTISLEIRHSMAGPHVTELRLSAGATQLSTTDCAGKDDYTICSVQRSELLQLDMGAPGALEMWTANNQAVERFSVNTAALVYASE